MCPEITNLEKQSVLSTFMNFLRVSGYDMDYRYHMIKGNLNGQAQLELEFENGTKACYRSISVI